MEIILYASLDLDQAGFCNSDAAVASFEEAFIEAAQIMEEEIGEPITVNTRDNYDTAPMTDYEVAVWQALHDMLEQIGPEEWRCAKAPIPPRKEGFAP